MARYTGSEIDGGGADLGTINVTPDTTPAGSTQELTREERLKQLKADREGQMIADAEQRAASNPMFDPTNRPEAPAADKNFIYYYSWVGGAGTGEWKLYRAVNNQINQNTYGSRAVGGATQGDFSSAVGANALQSQPQPIKDPYGNIIGWTGGDGTGGAGGTGGTGGTGGGGGGGGGTGGGGTGAGTGSTTKTYTAPDGKIFTDLNAYNAYIAQTAADAKRKAGQSAYDLLFSEFDRYGLGALVEPLKQFITEGLSRDEFTLRLRQTDAYQKRFAANAQRIKSGLRALSEAEYIQLEDQYQNVMRNYGLPVSYYTRGDMGRQQGFEKFIAGDVSAAELEDRIQTAQNRVINANPEVSKALREFFPEITNADILAYVLDPENSLGTIKRKVTISEIGGAAFEQALKSDVTRASELASYGVTGQAYRQAAPTIRQAAERGSQLASFFKETPYTQQTAESMALGVGDAASALERTRKLTERERALYSGTSGASVLSRDRAGQI